MLTSLAIENFRAFGSAEVDLSRLNIFVGPNNSGKSSIISAINLIAQNLRSGSQEFSLKLNGPYAQLGTYYDAVHGHGSQSRMSIGFTIDKFTYNYRFRYRPQKREIELVKFQVKDEDITYLFSRTKDGSTHAFSSKRLDRDYVPTRIRTRFYGLYAFLSTNMAPNVYAESVGSDFNRRLRDFSFRSMQQLELHFAAFDSVGAFRAAPERTYHYTGEAPSSVGRFGENFAQMLASSASTRERSSSNILRRVASWFDVAGIAKDVRINSLTNRHFEILVEDNTGSKNNITDSGFGCSQVLPVLVAGYTLLKERRHTRPPMLVVQEPEIHLHPTAAAHLGTYFTELSRDGVQCFVETHSENIVLRVARHVALGHLTPDDVCIYWVTGDGDRHQVTRLELNADGTFATDWPAGFFPTRASETMQLARAASGIGSKDPLADLFAE